MEVYIRSTTHSIVRLRVDLRVERKFNFFVSLYLLRWRAGLCRGRCWFDEFEIVIVFIEKFASVYLLRIVVLRPKTSMIYCYTKCLSFFTKHEWNIERYTHRALALPPLCPLLCAHLERLDSPVYASNNKKLVERSSNLLNDSRLRVNN